MSYIEGNQVSRTNFSANGQTLELDVAALNTVRFEFSGTYNFTAVFEATVDGTNWFPAQVAMVNAPTIVTQHSTTNGVQAYEFSCHSVAKVRVRLTAFTSAGTHKVLIAGNSAAIETSPTVQLALGGNVIAVTTTASTNASVQKNSAGNLFELTVSNPTATAAYVKLYNKASAPTVGTDIPVMTIAIPATAAGVGEKSFNFGVSGKRFPLGIALAVTAAAAASDTAVAVAGVQIHGTYS